ncbi:YaaL family protein [Bacillaceae bacterium SIJ1]|uniref:YaaL family protein n=1 Tax=Litoribacterium kuwaitense TaxID=1398745 RepID=UPI0013EA4FEE|nr:YaaL family protein [Litoribacterium kuwaitense]NGP46673.1 YaaL family protein [Litoribacterium kuwaitense]
MKWKKRRLKKRYDEELLEVLDEKKTEWESYEALIHQTIDLPLEVRASGKIHEALYFFLLREARHRQLKRR